MVHLNTAIHHPMWGLGEIITAFLTRHVGQNAYRNNRITRRWQLQTSNTPHCLKYIQDIHFSTKQPTSTEVQSVTTQDLRLYSNFSAFGKFFPPTPLIIFSRIITKQPFVRGYCTSVRLIYLAMVSWITEIVKCCFLLCLLKLLAVWCSKN